jgi:hypothetical protein
MVKIHEPEFIVLYNGTDPYPDYSELRLSDSFMDIEGLKPEKNRKIPLELVVQVYNINHGHNMEKGIEKGIEQTARNFLAIGITIDDIVRATGLPEERVRILASEGA